LLSAIRENSPLRGSDNRSVAETNSNLTTKASHGQCNFFLKVLAFCRQHSVKIFGISTPYTCQKITVTSYFATYYQSIALRFLHLLAVPKQFAQPEREVLQKQ
jgi:hypothetical protein